MSKTRLIKHSIHIRRLHSGSSHDGFTLIEIIVGLGILSIVMIAFLTLFAAAFRVNNAVDNNSKAFYLAESYMEQIYSESKAGSYSALTDKLKNAAAYDFEEAGSANEFKRNQDGFHVRLKFTKSDDLYKVLIKVFEKEDDISSKQLAQIEDILPFK
ncbi:hypothetical protein MASR2M70_15840 [Bacillota bacterium]